MAVHLGYGTRLLLLAAVGFLSAAGLVMVAGLTDAGEPEEDGMLVIRGKTTAGKTIHEAPPFEVPPRTDDLDYFPCSDCHEDEEFNPIERELEEERDDILLVHGAERFWCTTCHNTEHDSDTFISLKGQPIDFDQAYLLCGQCHFERQKDWYFGGHGKRAGAWRVHREIPATHDELLVEDREEIGKWGAERVILSCTACHDPHNPSIKPYELSPPPLPRKGLVRVEGRAKPHRKIWERHTGGEDAH